MVKDLVVGALVAVSCCSPLVAGIAQASTYTVTLTQEASDVLATGSGTVDLTGLNSFGSSSLPAELYPDHGIIGIGSGGNDSYSGLTGPFDFGPGFGGFASTTSGDSVRLEDFGDSLELPSGYVSGAFLFGTATYAGTIASNNLTPGTYTWTWNSGADDFVLQVPSIPGTPELSTWAMMAIGFAGLGLAGWRGSQKTTTVAA